MMKDDELIVILRTKAQGLAFSLRWLILEVLRRFETKLREQEQSKWISVKERLPERGQKVLCYMKYEPDQSDIICDNTYNGPLVGTRGKVHIWQFDGDFVTHWMPLPEPPKEGADHEK